MRKSIYYMLVACLSLSCVNKDKQKDSDTLPLPEVIDTAAVISDESEISVSDEPLEDGFLDFFNPIGIIGTGLINISSYVEAENQEVVYTEKITIYNDQACTDLFCSYDIDQAWNPPGDVIPIYNSINYGWYCFVCTDSIADSYEVAINKTDRKYIRKDRNIKYYTWENFFQSVFTIDPTEENPLRESPSDDAPPVVDLRGEDEGDYPEDYHQEVRLQDEWLHIKYKKSGHEGWLRWRRGYDIIVSIFISW